MNRTSGGKNVAPSLPVLVVCLWVCAGVLAVGGFVCGIVRLVVAVEHRNLDALGVLASLGYFIGGLIAACALWAVSYIVRRLQHADLAQRIILSSSPAHEETAASNEGPVARPGPIDPDLAEQILTELSEINTNLLMPNDEREAKRQRRQSEVTEKIVEEAEQAIAAGDFERAERLAERVAREFGDAARRNLLAERIAKAHVAAQAERIAAERHRIEELMSIASFRQAQELARELVEKYPDSPEPSVLLDRVMREADAFVAEHRKRLYGEVQRFAEARQWRAAFASAQRLLAEYPNSPEADKVALTMPTIQENTRIEDIRHLRDTLRDLIQRRRYGDAVRIAHDILARFPNTQVAAELRPQMERLEKLAEGDQDMLA